MSSFQMKPFSTKKFYGEPKLHVCKNHSITLVVDTLSLLIFKALRFPIRSKPKTRLRVKILKKDIKYIKEKSLDQLLRLYSSHYDPSWRVRVVSVYGDHNEVVESSVHVRKCRSDTDYVKDSKGAFRPMKRSDGMEVVVTITRQRRVGETDTAE